MSDSHTNRLTQSFLGRAFLLVAPLYLAAIIVAPHGARGDEHDESGRNFVEACRAAANNFPDHNTDMFKAGICVGQIAAMEFSGGELVEQKLRSCVPDDVTHLQMAKVVVGYLDGHPDLLDKPLTILITVALAQTWPCRR